jgi:hypothetical protein
VAGGNVAGLDGVGATGAATGGLTDGNPIMVRAGWRGGGGKDGVAKGGGVVPGRAAGIAVEGRAADIIGGRGAGRAADADVGAGRGCAPEEGLAGGLADQLAGPDAGPRSMVISP